MRQLLKRFWLAFVIIGSASAVLLASDLQSRRRAEAATGSRQRPIAPAEGPAAQAQPGRHYTIGTVYYAPEQGQDLAMQGLLDGLAELGYHAGKNLDVQRQHAQGEMNNIVPVLHNFDSSDVDAIVTFTTPVLTAACGAVRRKPVVFTYVTDPIAGGAGVSWTEHLLHVTGIGSFPPLEDTMDFIQTVLPRFKRLGVIYNSGEANSVKVVTELRRILQARDKELVETTAAATNEVSQAMLALVQQRIDAVYLPGDNTAYQAYDVVVQVCRDAEVPLIVDMPEYTARGALAGIGVGFYQSAKATAQLLGRVLNGESPGRIPMQNLSIRSGHVNLQTAKELGITFPPAVLKDFPPVDPVR